MCSRSVVLFADAEVLHSTGGFGVLAEVGVKKATCSAVLVGAGKRQLFTDQIVLERSKRMTDANVVVRARMETWSIEVRAKHHEKIGVRSGFLGRRLNGSCN